TRPNPQRGLHTAFPKGFLNGFSDLIIKVHNPIVQVHDPSSKFTIRSSKFTVARPGDRVVDSDAVLCGLIEVCESVENRESVAHVVGIAVAWGEGRALVFDGTVPRAHPDASRSATAAAAVSQTT